MYICGGDGIDQKRTVERPVIALVADPGQGCWLDKAVTKDTPSIASGTDSSDRCARLLFAHDKIRMVFAGREREKKGGLVFVCEWMLWVTASQTHLIVSFFFFFFFLFLVFGRFSFLKCHKNKK